MDDGEDMVAKALPNVCVLLKLVSASLTLLRSPYRFLPTSSPSGLSKISFRLSSLLLFPILLRMGSKALCKHSPVSPPDPISYFHPLHSSFYFSSQLYPEQLCPCCSLAICPLLSHFMQISSSTAPPPRSPH